MFVRVRGCSLSCLWCDTDFTNPTPFVQNTEPDQLLQFILANVEDTRRVILTGGEPMLYQADRFGLVPLLLAIKSCVLHCNVEFETNGLVTPNDRLCMALASQTMRVQWNVSPKGANAGEENNTASASIAKWMDVHREVPGKIYFKFVISTDTQRQCQLDMEEAEALCSMHNVPPEFVIFSPMGTDVVSMVRGSSWILQSGFLQKTRYRFIPRLHILAGVA